MRLSLQPTAKKIVECFCNCGYVSVSTRRELIRVWQSDLEQYSDVHFSPLLDFEDMSI